MIRRLNWALLLVLLVACGPNEPAPGPTRTEPKPVPTVEAAPVEATATPTTPSPAPVDDRPNRRLPDEEGSLLDPGIACAPTEPGELAAAAAFAASLPFSAQACLTAIALPDRREVLLGAGGQYVPVHTAQLGPGSKVLAPFAGQIDFRVMQSDLPAGYHLYGAGSLRITIRPQGEDGKGVEHSPVIYLYVPGDSELAAEFADRPGASAGAVVERRQVIVESLGDSGLDPQGNDHDLILFYEAEQQFVDLLAPGSEVYWVGGTPRV
jgi:hypothetical protein